MENITETFNFKFGDELIFHYSNELESKIGHKTQSSLERVLWDKLKFQIDDELDAQMRQQVKVFSDKF